MSLNIALLVVLAFANPPGRQDRLVALARLDAAVRYFHPVVATRATSWDSLFAARALRIVDAPTASDYGREVAALMAELPDPPTATGAQRALIYSGFPPVGAQSSGGYWLKWRSAGGGETYRVSMGEGVSVDVRTSEPGSDTTASITPSAPPNNAEWQAPYPATGYRILAAVRLYNTIRLFYPYKSLMGGSWDTEFRSALIAVEGAGNDLEYAKAIAAFAAHINDTHVTVANAALRTFLGAVPVGAAARLIENQLVITRIADSSASAAGLSVGDIVESVDGEAVTKRIDRLTPYLSVSTPQSLRYRLQGSLTSGSDSLATLVVRGATGGVRTLEVPRSARFGQMLADHRTGSMIRMLPGNIGYVDLDRLPTTMVDSAFRVLGGAKAIIFDDRGYPNGTAWPIAPRLNTHGDGTTAAKFRRLIVPSPDTTRTTVFTFDQPIPPATPGVPQFAGRTVMMVDERTISQAEHTGLFFEAANGTTFVGSPTMGANGDVTRMVLPGGISISFTGHDVRHADGRQLQRVGLEPQIKVTPTLAGIRAGRDEVLEAAFKAVGGSGPIPVDTFKELPLAVLAAEPSLNGWTNIGTPGLMRIGADSLTAHSGRSSGHVTSRAAQLQQQDFGGVMQSIRADSYRGKRIRFSAYLKTKNVPLASTGAVIWMRVDGNGGVMAFDNMNRRPVVGTADWTQVVIVLDVPVDAVGIAAGAMLTSAGEAWIDDATLEVVGADLPSTNTMQPQANPEQLEQQKARYANRALSLVNLGFERP